MPQEYYSFNTNKSYDYLMTAEWSPPLLSSVVLIALDTNVAVKEKKDINLFSC